MENSGLLQLKEDLVTIYDMWSGNRDRQNRKHHSEHGALRSGEGTPSQMAMRQHEFEERSKMEAMEAAGEHGTDSRTQKRQFEYYKEKVKSKRTGKQDDRFDFIEEDTVLLHEDIGMVNL